VRIYAYPALRPLLSCRCSLFHSQCPHGTSPLLTLEESRALRSSYNSSTHRFFYPLSSFTPASLQPKPAANRASDGYFSPCKVVLNFRPCASSGLPHTSFFYGLSERYSLLQAFPRPFLIQSYKPTIAASAGRRPLRIVEILAEPPLRRHRRVLPSLFFRSG